MAQCFVFVFCGIVLLLKPVSSQIVLNNLAPVDLTLDSESTGVDVVDATLLKIDSVTVPNGTLRNDFGFLRRIALVESSFGNTSSGSNGGIWQITPHISSFLSNIGLPTAVQDLVDSFGLAFGNSVIDFATGNFDVPLNSAVAARIFIEIQLSVSNDDFPGSINDQATWWATEYRNSNGNATVFADTVRDYEAFNQCNVSTMDLWFLIDGSGSIGASNFNTCLSFVDQTAAQFDIHPDRVRTGLMIYSGSTQLRSRFDEHQSNVEFSTVVLSTSYPSGSTYTGVAINETAQVGFNENNGARPVSDGVPRVLVVLTDGRSADDIVIPSAQIKQQGVTVFGVGVGSALDVAEVNEIASDPDATYAYELSQFLDLVSVLRDAVADQACSVSTAIPEDTNVTLVNEPGSISYSQVVLPASGYLELTFNVQINASVGIVYISVTVTNPGPAFYDAMFEITFGVTIARYNVDLVSSATQKRPTTLYMGFENRGSEPINLEISATATQVTSSSNTLGTTTLQTSGSAALKRFEMLPLVFLGTLVCFM